MGKVRNKFKNIENIIDKIYKIKGKAKLRRKSKSKSKKKLEKQKEQEERNRLQEAIEKLSGILQEGNFVELTYILGNKKEIIKRNLLAGITRGVGIGIGVTIITAILVIVLQKIVALNIPIIRRIYSRYSRDSRKKQIIPGMFCRILLHFFCRILDFFVSLTIFIIIYIIYLKRR